MPKQEVKVYVYDSGASAKPTLLLIHGLGDDADTWRHVFIPLAEKYRVVALDLPGFGRSDKPRRIYSIKFLRDVLIELMDALSLGQVVLMGNSLGAILAEIVAIKHPTRVAGLVLLDGTVSAPVFSYHRSFLLMALPLLGRRLYGSLRGNPQAAYDSLRLFFAHLENLPEADRQFLYQRVNQRMWDDRQRDAFLSLLHQLVWCEPLRKHHFARCLGRLCIPTQIIWGEHDAVLPVECAHDLLAKRPGCQLTVLPETGHIPQQENPDAVVQVLI
ncbi:MAG: alpha/beta fold hydrolase [Candidatus Methylumidiphilus sp.]